MKSASLTIGLLFSRSRCSGSGRPGTRASASPRRSPIEEIDKGGNGAHEISNWIGVMGCLPNPESRGSIAAYEPIVSWVTGCAAVTWDV